MSETERRRAVETQNGRGPVTAAAGSSERALVRAAVGVFLLVSLVNMLCAMWVTSVLSAATALLVVGGVDNWPKRAQYAYIVLYVALAAAGFLEMFRAVAVLFHPGEPLR